MKIEQQRNHKKWIALAAAVLLVSGAVGFTCARTMKAKASDGSRTGTVTISENYKKKIADSVYDDVMERMDDAVLAELGQQAVTAYLQDHQVPVSEEEKEQLLQLLVRELEADGVQLDAQFFSEEQKSQLAKSVQKAVESSVGDMEVAGSGQDAGKEKKASGDKDAGQASSVKGANGTGQKDSGTTVSSANAAGNGSSATATNGGSQATASKIPDSQLQQLKQEIQKSVEQSLRPELLAAASKSGAAKISTADWNRITTIAKSEASKLEGVQAKDLAKYLPKKGVDYFTKSEIASIQKTISGQVYTKVEKKLNTVTKKLDSVKDKSTKLSGKLTTLSQKITKLQTAEQKQDSTLAASDKKLQKEVNAIQKELEELAEQSSSLSESVAVDGAEVTVVQLKDGEVQAKQENQKQVSVSEYLDLLASNDANFAQAVQKLNESLKTLETKTGQSYTELKKELEVAQAGISQQATSQQAASQQSGQAASQQSGQAASQQSGQAASQQSGQTVSQQSGQTVSQQTGQATGQQTGQTQGGSQVTGQGTAQSSGQTQGGSQAMSQSEVEKAVADSRQQLKEELAQDQEQLKQELADKQESMEQELQKTKLSVERLGAYLGTDMDGESEGSDAGAGNGAENASAIQVEAEFPNSIMGAVKYIWVQLKELFGMEQATRVPSESNLMDATLVEKINWQNKQIASISEQLNSMKGAVSSTVDPSLYPATPEFEFLKLVDGGVKIKVTGPSDKTIKPYKYNIYAIRQDQLEDFSNGQEAPDALNEYGTKRGYVKEIIEDKEYILDGLDNNAIYYVCVTTQTRDGIENADITNQKRFYCYNPEDPSGYVYNELALELTPWEQIYEIGIHGDAENYFAVGDTKTLLDGRYSVRIIGFNQDEVHQDEEDCYRLPQYNKDGIYAAYTFQFTEALNDLGTYKIDDIYYQERNSDQLYSCCWYRNHKMNAQIMANSNAVYAYSSHASTSSNIIYEGTLKDLVEGRMYDILPDEVKEHIVRVKKQYSIFGSLSNTYAAKIFALSETEVSGEQKQSEFVEGQQYSYYQNGETAPDGWLRTASQERMVKQLTYYTYYEYVLPQFDYPTKSETLTGYLYGLCKVENGNVQTTYKDELSVAPAFCF